MKLEPESQATSDSRADNPTAATGQKSARLSPRILLLSGVALAVAIFVAWRRLNPPLT